jgi:hypothetical protein
VPVIKIEMLFGLATFALFVFCLVDVIQTPERNIRNLSKVIWLLLVLFFPFVGSVAWLVAGRPESGPRRESPHERRTADFPEYDRPGRASSADPDSDDAFLRQVRERAEEQRRRHEADRRQRERERENPPAAGATGE